MSLPPSPTKRRRQRFPMVIRNGSVSAKIYRLERKYQKRGATKFRTVYSVAYSGPEKRKVRQFGKLSSAMDAARLAVDQIAAGEAEGSLMTKTDRNELMSARQRSGDTPLLAAIGEWARAHELAAGEVIAACTAWGQRKTKLQHITVELAVERFLAAKRSEGVDTTNSYEGVLAKFKRDFAGRNLDHIHTRELREWLSKINHPVSRNTHRKRIVTLFRWARAEEYLARDMTTEAELTKAAQETATARALITPEMLQKLLDGCKAVSGFIPAIVVSAFAGLRSIEAHAQLWEDIDLKNKYLRVTKAKKGTPADRYVVLQPCAIAWLELTPEAERTGLIHPYKTEVFTMIRNYARETLKLTLPKNCFRKSWVSHRLAVTQDLAATSLEGGHSSQVEIRHYRGAVTPAQGARWFEVVSEKTLKKSRKQRKSNGVVEINDYLKLVNLRQRQGLTDEQIQESLNKEMRPG